MTLGAVEEALAEYTANKASVGENGETDHDRVEEIIDTLDSNGAWITTMRVRQYEKGMLDPPPVYEVEGIDVSVFIRNMSALIDYIADNK